MKFFLTFRYSLSILICFSCSLTIDAVCRTDTTYYKLWDIDTLENIGGYPTTITGNPQVVSTDLGRAVQFDGDGDRLLIDGNPLGDAKTFTIEIIFKPEGAYPQNTDPRFVHIQDPEDAAEKRVLIELRITPENSWYLDGFMNTDIASLTLVNESLTHETGKWMHAAITYDNGIFKTYVNGEQELTGNVACSSEIVAPDAKTSLGSRMNERNWYRGIIKTLKVTHRVLLPEEFLKIGPEVTKVNEQNEHGVMLLPNPANQHITVILNSGLLPCFVRLLNLTGEIIFPGEQLTGSNTSCQIDTSNLPEGIYLVQISSYNQCENERILIKH